LSAFAISIESGKFVETEVSLLKSKVSAFAITKSQASLLESKVIVFATSIEPGQLAGIESDQPLPQI
jgi:hypothetical protein